METSQDRINDSFLSTDELYDMSLTEISWNGSVEYTQKKKNRTIYLMYLKFQIIWHESYQVTMLK